MAREMKDSGIEWIGDIPSTWSTSKLKYLGRYINGYAFKPEEWGATGLPIIRIQDLTGSNDNPNFYDGEIDAKYLVSNGDILVSWAATLDAFIWEKGKGWLNQHIFKDIPDESIIDRDYFFWMIKESMKNMNNDNKHGIFMQHVTLDVFNNFTIPMPHIKEQHRIAIFLDRKCAEIDSVIAETQKTIEEYKALKQSIITEAVTKGVRGERPMKDSGIEWIGEIPVDWSIERKISNLCSKQISYGIVKLGEPDDEGVFVLRCSDVLAGSICLDNVRTVSRKLSNEYARTILQGNEIVINVRGTLGGCAVVPSSLSGYNVAREVAVIQLTSTNNSNYIMYYLLSSCFKIYEEMHLLGSVYIGLNIELLSSTPTILPPIDEQCEIVSYLSKKCDDIDAIVAKKEQFLAEIENYKKNLIYEYVTGKKEEK